MMLIWKKIFLGICFMHAMILSAAGTAAEEAVTLKIVGSPKFYCNTGTSLHTPLMVQLFNQDGSPKSGVQIDFEVINYKNDTFLSHNLVMTDVMGIATVELALTKNVPDNAQINISANCHGDESTRVYYYITAQSPYWMKFLFFSLLGGLALFLLGMEMTKLSLQKVAGRKLKTILTSVTNNRFLGVMIGTLVTAVIQSSTATTVMVVGFVSAGLIGFVQSMSITMGAEIGTTFTVQLIAFKLTDYALLVIFLGFLVKVSQKDELRAQYGTLIMGLGMIFYGIKVMADSMQPLKDYPPIIEMLKNLNDPFYALLLGTFLTALIHSGATMAILIALGSQNMITLQQAIPIAFGANIGTTITAIIASWGSNVSAVKAAYWHALHKVLGALIFYPFIPQYARLIEKITLWSGSDSVPRQIANAHTVFNVVNVFLFIGFIQYFARLMDWLVKDSSDKPKFKTYYIKENLLDTPTLALEQAYREILHMANIVERMIINIKPSILEKDYRLIQKNINKDDKVDVLEEKINPFLTTISGKELSEVESRRLTGMLFVVDNLEHIGDIISKNLMKLAQKTIDQDYKFSEDGYREIFEYYDKTLNNYRQLLLALRKEDFGIAKALSEYRPQIEPEAKKYYLSHFKRMQKGMKETVETSPIHLDMIDCLRAINFRIAEISSNLAFEIIGSKN
ncbi:MAG: Na/Pi cotransporter family protein [Candidatus Wallbacteria bacterium]|nr:Na/Pi cotransporter family protein [Candidatus Wallbacteria bacterium]